MLLTTTISANAALIGVLPSTPGGTDYQAYYDDQLNISWLANANAYGGPANWFNASSWAAGLTVNGVGGCRLPNMDINGDGSNANLVDCSAAGTSQSACADNEYGHLFYYGAGTTKGAGITTANQSPFSNIQSGGYWSSTEHANIVLDARVFDFGTGANGVAYEYNTANVWAVHDGDVSLVPLPAAAWLFGSALLGLAGFSKRRSLS